MSKTEHISLYNLGLEKLVLDMYTAIHKTENQQLIKGKYSLFYPMIGKDYYEKKELLIYGQYAGNWKPVFRLTKDKKQVEALVKKAYEYSVVSRGCPLDWVNKYWIKQSLYRSFFWNIAYKLGVERYGRTENDWNHIMAYSNLLKAVPEPDVSMPPEIYNAQLHNAAHLFKEELSLLQPRNVILITNLQNWAEPILRTAGIKFETHRGGYLQATSAYRGSRILVMEKPFAGNHRIFLDEVKRNMI